MQKKRVLILSTSAGAGHVRAGAALEKAFAADDRVEKVVHEDALKYTNKLFRDFYSTLYIKLVHNAPGLLGYFYRASDEPWKNETVAPAVRPAEHARAHQVHPRVRSGHHRLHALHAGGDHLAPHRDRGSARRSSRSSSPISTATRCGFRAFFTATSWRSRRRRSHLEALGLPGDRITVSGIPIDPVFAEPVDRAAVRQSFGLQPDLPTLLLSAGALGVAPAELIVQRLEEGLHRDVQTIVVCGRERGAARAGAETGRGDIRASACSASPTACRAHENQRSCSSANPAA